MELSEGKRRNDRDSIEGPVFEGPDFGDQDPMRPPGGSADSSRSADDFADSESRISEQAPVRPFESFEDLPEDVEEATNAFKVSIIRHRSLDWEEISQSDMLGLLDALKVLVSQA